jgi:hypothetical protein
MARSVLKLELSEMKRLETERGVPEVISVEGEDAKCDYVIRLSDVSCWRLMRKRWPSSEPAKLA